MPYLVDSDIIIDHLAAVPAARKLLTQLSEAGIAISIITYMETYQGVLRSPQSAQANQHFAALLHTVPVLPFSMSVAKRCAQLREDLQQEGKRVHGRALDLMTAAIAIEHHLTLVTRNVEDYRDIPGLQVYKTGWA